MIKAVFFDIDGTLVSFSSHEVPLSAVESIKRLKEKGIRVFVASGRHRLSMNNLDLSLFDGVLSLNGGICYVGNDLVYKRSIDKRDVKALMKILNHEECFPCLFLMENDVKINYFNSDTEEVFDLLGFQEPKIAAPDEIENDPVYQFVSFFNSAQKKKVMQALSNCVATSWHPLFADVIPKGVNKWVGILEILKRFSISPEETMAFGDGGNDLEMLSNAGIGVAMGESEEQVKAAADYITDTVENDGIKKALEYFGLI